MNISAVSKQYEDDKNLSIRILLHQKYSTNKYGYTNWIFDNLQFFEGCKVLEVGCGNGTIWHKRMDRLPMGTSLILSDFSQGMVDIVREQYGNLSHVTTRVLNVMDIPYEENSFDIVIANSMLYHVPDLDQGIREIWRVLKPGGKLYSTTLGKNGMFRYLHDKLKEFDLGIDIFKEDNIRFNMENGKEILGRCFDRVERYDYEDSLAVTETKDLIAWIHSHESMTGVVRSVPWDWRNFWIKARMRAERSIYRRLPGCLWRRSKGKRGVDASFFVDKNCWFNAFSCVMSIR